MQKITFQLIIKFCVAFSKLNTKTTPPYYELY